jgi:hypothetical protein
VVHEDRRRADAGHQSRSTAVVDVGRDDARALGDEEPGDGGADAVGGARDERDLADQSGDAGALPWVM